MKAKTSSKSKQKNPEVLTFNKVGDPIEINEILNEFTKMRDAIKKPIKPEDFEQFGKSFERVGKRSGTHLIKIRTPRADLDQSVLRIKEKGTNRIPDFFPSGNARDNRIAKVIFRPIRILDHDCQSVVGSILNPNKVSEHILNAFKQTFGCEALTKLRIAITDKITINELPTCGEFPIIFVPHPKGGDLQITPISSINSFMKMKEIKSNYSNPKFCQWSELTVSNKPQNISGVISKSRIRFLATLPEVMKPKAAELFRFAKGGNFPLWRNSEVSSLVIDYANRLEQHEKYNNTKTRRALNIAADRLIIDAFEFFSETISATKDIIKLYNLPEKALSVEPDIDRILINRRWDNNDHLNRARNALNSSHFYNRRKEFSQLNRTWLQ